MELIYYLLILPLAANFISEWSGVIDKLKYWMFYRMYTKQTQYDPPRWKPFDCPMCFSFWISIGLLIYNSDYSIINCILPFASAAMGMIINKIGNRL